MRSRTRVIATAIAIAAVTGMSVTMATPANAVGSVSSYCNAHLYDNNQALTGLPNQSLQCQMQYGPAASGDPDGTAQQFYYVGPVDGAMGTNSWKGVMAFLKAKWGYAGPVDGVPGANTYNAMIRAANWWGWNGITNRPQDGNLDQGDWQGWAAFVRGHWFAG